MVMVIEIGGSKGHLHGASSHIHLFNVQTEFVHAVDVLKGSRWPSQFRF